MEHSGKDIYEMHALVRGNVQGVGFRAITRYYAMELGLTGTVCNLENGAVEIYAHGSKKRLEALMEKLKEESFPARIEEASIEFFPIDIPHEEEFRIIH